MSWILDAVFVLSCKWIVSFQNLLLRMLLLGACHGCMQLRLHIDYLLLASSSEVREVKLVT